MAILDWMKASAATFGQYPDWQLPFKWKYIAQPLTPAFTRLKVRCLFAIHSVSYMLSSCLEELACRCLHIEAPVAMPKSPMCLSLLSCSSQWKLMYPEVVYWIQIKINLALPGRYNYTLGSGGWGSLCLEQSVTDISCMPVGINVHPGCGICQIGHVHVCSATRRLHAFTAVILLLLYLIWRHFFVGYA